jgi:hypothetical protein
MERRTSSFGSASRSTTVVDAPANQTSYGELSWNAKVRETMELLEELRADERNEFANTMTGDESWFCLSYESDSMFAMLTFNFRSGHV